MKFSQLLISAFMGFIGILILKHNWSDFGLSGIISSFVGIMLIIVCIIGLSLYFRKILLKKIQQQ